MLLFGSEFVVNNVVWLLCKIDVYMSENKFEFVARMFREIIYCYAFFEVRVDLVGLLLECKV